jgi:hypothetical protein
MPCNRMPKRASAALSSMVQTDRVAPIYTRPSGDKFVFLASSAIDLIEAVRNYVVIHAGKPPIATELQIPNLSEYSTPRILCVCTSPIFSISRASSPCKTISKEHSYFG